jgi:hypothetical protein
MQLLKMVRDICCLSKQFFFYYFVEPGTPGGMQYQSSVIPTKVITQPVVRQTVVSQQTATPYTESQINDFVSKCRTFLTTLLRLAEKQAPEKLPMVRSCIQELLVLKILFKKKKPFLLLYRTELLILNHLLNDFIHCINLNHIYHLYHFSK